MPLVRDDNYKIYECGLCATRLNKDYMETHAGRRPSEREDRRGVAGRK